MALTSGSEIELLLRGGPVFASVRDSVLSDFAARGRLVAVKKDRSVVEQGILWPYLGVVATGALQAVLASESGREHSLFELGKGEVFGEMSVLDHGETMLRYVAASTSAAIVLVPADVVRRECELNPSFSAALSAVAIQRTRIVLDRFSSHLALPATNRIANVLFEIDERGTGSGSGRALADFTQVQLARMAGTVREVVQRVLAILQADGIVQMERGRVISLDRVRLRQRIEHSSWPERESGISSRRQLGVDE
jgi:CRP/FNR family transcriptional regulator